MPANHSKHTANMTVLIYSFTQGLLSLSPAPRHRTLRSQPRGSFIATTNISKNCKHNISDNHNTCFYCFSIKEESPAPSATRKSICSIRLLTVHTVSAPLQSDTGLPRRNIHPKLYTGVVFCWACIQITNNNKRKWKLVHINIKLILCFHHEHLLVLIWGCLCYEFNAYFH